MGYADLFLQQLIILGGSLRKFITEWTIVITVLPAILGRQQDFQRMAMPDTEDPCHIYLVSRRPRMSILPSSVEITDNRISGTVRLQHQDQWEEFNFSTPHSLGAGPLRWTGEWPYEEYAIKNAEGAVISKGVVALLHAYIRTWPKIALQHEVVYVGQAFGHDGERTAWDRLQRHETVQRIHAETPPDKQVWLTLAAISDINLLSEIDPRHETTTSSSEDDTHISQVMEAIHDGTFKEKQAVALAEAGLIRFFQPAYNDRMKYRFPARKQVSLETARGLDLHGMIVELQGENVDAQFGSSVISYAWEHFAGFVIHEDQDRDGTMTLEAAEIAPGMPPKG